MNYKCPGCNTELESDFRYCPSCGIDLREAVKHEDEPLPSVADDLIAEDESTECAVCGELNNSSHRYCKSCGAVINEEGTDNRGVYSQEIITSGIKNTTESAPEKKEISYPAGKNSRKGKKETIIAVREKSLSNAVLFGLLGMLAVLAVIMMYIAGTFNTPELANNQDHVHSEGDGHNHSSLQIDPKSVQAIEQLKTELVSNPGDLEKRLNLAHLLSDNGNFQEAIDNYKTYLTAKPGIPEVIIDMGVCYFNMNNLDEAEKAFLDAVKINPAQQIGLLNLGVVNLQKNNISKAKEWLQKAVEVNPTSPSGMRAKELLENQ